MNFRTPEYEWDPDKDIENRRKHGLSLGDGIMALEDPDAAIWFDDRFDYDEERIITLGQTWQGVLFVVTTEITEDLTRIISVRRARTNEKERYYQSRS